MSGATLPALQTATARGALSWRRVNNTLRRAYVPLLIVILWQAGSDLGLYSVQTVPPPTVVAAAAWQLATSGQLAINIWVSLERVFFGLSIGVAVGTSFALIAGLSRIGEDALDSTVQMVRTLPHLALIPLMIMWFGIGETPKITLIALGSMFPIYLNLFAGIRGADRKLREAAGTLGLSHFETILHVVLPAALPNFLVGLRQAFGISWITLVVAEQINANAGIGYLVMNARDFLRTDIIFVGLTIYALLGLLTDSSVRFLERHLLAWRPTYLAPGSGEMNMINTTLVADRPVQAEAETAVAVRNLTRDFGGPAVLENLSFTIARGEFVALLGRSGSGKSTLLRTLAGLDPAPAESLNLPQARAVVFQEPRLLPWKRVLANVTLGLRSAHAAQKARAALVEVELSHREHAWPLTLSGGEAQRAALARALVREPELLLLDEPFAALDALTRLRMQGLVGELWAAHRPAVLLVTHDVDEALLLADRVMLLRDGKIAVDRPVELSRPRRHADPAFNRMRAELLADLGVHGAD